MIGGIGIDTVEIQRMKRAMARWPRLVERILTEGEVRETAGAPHRVAARWAAKEALFKAVDMPARGLALAWREIEVRNTASGRPFFVLSGRTAALMRRLGWRLHLSISHDRGWAIAVVVAEKGPRSRGRRLWGYKSGRRKSSWN